MKKINIVLFFVLGTTTIMAQPTVRNARVADTIKIPGLKTINKRVAVNSRSQIAVASVDTTKTLFTEDPKLLQMVSGIMLNTVPVNLTLTPSKPCIDQDNCIFSNNTITEIGKTGESWIFLKDYFRRILERLSLVTRLQPNKDYLMVLDVEVKEKPWELELMLYGFHIKGYAGPLYFNIPFGKTQVAIIFHTDADYKFAGLGPDCSYFTIAPSPIFGKEYPADAHKLLLSSIKIKELKLN